MPSIAPTQETIFTALKAFLVAVSPDGMEVTQGQLNRVPEPQDVLFATFWPLRTERLATNIRSAQRPSIVTGYIVADQFMVAQVDGNEILVGDPVLGFNVADGTTIAEDVTGNGGPGTYRLSAVQEPASSGEYFVGASLILVEQSAQMAIQVDVHGTNESAADLSQIITTLFRDPYGIDLFHETSPYITPLYCSSPRQMPFINEGQQFESRWSTDLEIQVKQTIALPQDFAAVLSLQLVQADSPSGYATVGTIVGNVVADQLLVSQVGAGGPVMVGQMVALGGQRLTTITAQIAGVPGGPGAYQVDPQVTEAGPNLNLKARVA